MRNNSNPGPNPVPDPVPDPVPAPANRWCRGLFWFSVAAGIVSLGIMSAAGASGVATGEDIEAIGNIERAARSFLYRQAGGDRGASVEVTINSVDPRLRLRRCDHDLVTSPAPGARPEGNTSVKIECQGPVRWSLFVSGRVERFGDVVVANGTINRGSLVTAADLRLERRETGGLMQGYFDDPSNAIGKQVRRSLRPGDVVTDSHLTTPLWVERGQLVRLLSDSGSIRVIMSGEALDGGSGGDRIRVRNSSSKRVVEGTIEAPGVVRIPM